MLLDLRLNPGLPNTLTARPMDQSPNVTEFSPQTCCIFVLTCLCVYFKYSIDLCFKTCSKQKPTKRVSLIETLYYNEGNS